MKKKISAIVAALATCFCLAMVSGSTSTALADSPWHCGSSPQEPTSVTN